MQLHSLIRLLTFSTQELRDPLNRKVLINGRIQLKPSFIHPESFTSPASYISSHFLFKLFKYFKRSLE
jgi:hypothetical protein